MNLNQNPEELKKEEQVVLDDVISRMDKMLLSLDKRMREYVIEAKNNNISLNPDAYLGYLLARKGIADTRENRKRLLEAREELYHTRLLLHYENEESEGIEEVKIGLHSCFEGINQLVASWTETAYRSFIVNEAATSSRCVVDGKYQTDYQLLAREKVTLKFTHVDKAVNLYPAIADEEAIRLFKESGFFSPSFIDGLAKIGTVGGQEPETLEKIVADEFLKELLERRASTEFRNIVFSIQKRQGEIIQAPFERNLIVQGCAGSGKSMIMMHRLPILLYDNPENLVRTNLYIITPSKMYEQLAENMRHQLEISDIKMGTIEEYYDFCISKYTRTPIRQYGKIDNRIVLSSDIEQYVYSNQCIEDIRSYYEEEGQVRVSLKEAYELLGLRRKTTRIENAKTFAEKINRQILEIQSVLSSNSNVLHKYYQRLTESIRSFNLLGYELSRRKSKILNEITKKITKLDDEIRKAVEELGRLNPQVNSVAVKNRNMLISLAQKDIDALDAEKKRIDADEQYFDSLIKLKEKIESITKLFARLNLEDYSQNDTEELYEALDNIGQLIGGYYMISWEYSRIEEKYSEYAEPIEDYMNRINQRITALQNLSDKYLDHFYYKKIADEEKRLQNVSENAIQEAYMNIMTHIGVNSNRSRSIRTIKCSPYLYLQTIYLFQGPPPAGRDALLAIDEAQGLAVEEVRLLSNVNSNSVVFNLYGDIHQHFEGTKGIDAWNEFREVLDYDYYEMKENYRNASQITKYCNKVFNMNMTAISVEGRGVHEIRSEEALHFKLGSLFRISHREGLAAILVSNEIEAQYIRSAFSVYRKTFHDMTEGDNTIDLQKWNILKIEDAKGLEFNTVIVLAGRMSPNQKYVAFTRALDDLYVYSNVIDTKNKRNSKNEHEQRW